MTYIYTVYDGQIGEEIAKMLTNMYIRLLRCMHIIFAWTMLPSDRAKHALSCEKKIGSKKTFFRRIFFFSQIFLVTKNHFLFFKILIFWFGFFGKNVKIRFFLDQKKNWKKKISDKNKIFDSIFLSRDKACLALSRVTWFIQI